MAIRSIFKRNTNLLLVPTSPLPFRVSSFNSNAFDIVDEEFAKLPTINPPPPHPQTRFSSMIQPNRSRGSSNAFKIELVDHDSWQVSSGLSEAWKQMKGSKERNSSIVEPIDWTEDSCPHPDDEPEFDDIEDMRFRGKLFYKLDKDSREFDECNLEFQKKKSSRKRKEEPKERTKMAKSNPNLVSKHKEPSKLVRATRNKALPEEMDDSCDGKRLRTLTFNQLTAPYHEPFCLDICISKSSVRACIIHRVTSKVVVVAHSISKDMKFDLKSTKDENACVAVGEILAQRALADDIHDIVYTPRKGDKVEGKLEIVLQSLINHGLNVKVKIKQRKPKKSVQPLL